MFCPEGFVSLAELWGRYRERRLHDFYVSSAEHYASEDFSAAFVRGSPLDICEHIFLKSTSQCGLHLCSPDGRSMKVYAPLVDGHASLCSVHSVVGSAWRWDEHQKEADDRNDQTAEARYFLPWHGHPSEDALWSEAFPAAPSENLKRWKKTAERLRFHCLPLCYERPRYTVVKELPPWSQNIKTKGEISLLVENFGGWSICMSDADAEDWQPYLDGQPVYADQMQSVRREQLSGRPRLQEAALKDFDLTFPNGANLPWKAIPHEIESKTGNRYSESTIRRALDSRDDD